MYLIEANESIPVETELSPVSTNLGEVEWEVREGSVEAVRLVISGIALQRDPVSGAILALTDEIEQRAFQVASFIANCVLVQTGFNIYDP
jgi:hypothetical protein